MTGDLRVTRTRASVLTAAGELLAEEGREGFSIDGVAKRAGVARTTIYRHWPEAGDLLYDTVRAMAEPVTVPDTGSVHDDLVALYTGLNAGFRTSCVGRAMPVLLDISRRDPSLQPLHRAFIAERRRPAIAVIRRGIERGELPDDVDPDLLVDRIAGPVFYRHLVVQEPYSATDIERLVGDVLATRAPSLRGRGTP